MANLQTYDTGDLEIAAEFLTDWIPFLTGVLCDGCSATLRCRIDSLRPGSSPPAISSSYTRRYKDIVPTGWDLDPSPAPTDWNTEREPPSDSDKSPHAEQVVPTGWGTESEWTSVSTGWDFEVVQTPPPIGWISETPVIPTGCWDAQPETPIGQSAPAQTGVKVKMSWGDMAQEEEEEAMRLESGGEKKKSEVQGLEMHKWVFSAALSSVACPYVFQSPCLGLGYSSSSSIGVGHPRQKYSPKSIQFVSAGTIEPSQPLTCSSQIEVAQRLQEEREQWKSLLLYSPIALEIMLEMGYNIGTGLGKHHQGILVPVKIDHHPLKTGLGYDRKPSTLSYQHQECLAFSRDGKYQAAECEPHLNVIKEFKRLEI